MKDKIKYLSIPPLLLIAFSFPLILKMQNLIGSIEPTSQNPRYYNLWGNLGLDERACLLRDDATKKGVPYCLTGSGRGSGKIYPVPGLEDGGVIQMILSQENNNLGLAVKEDGSLWIRWGQKSTDKAKIVKGFESGVTKVVISQNTTIFVIKDGGLHVWIIPTLFFNSGEEHPLFKVSPYDEMTYSEQYEMFKTPTLIPGFESGVTDVAFGELHGCLVQYGKVFCWGSNYNGQIGVGYTTPCSGSIKVDTGLRFF